MSFYLRQGKSSVETGELRKRVTICERKEVTDRKTGIQKLEYVPITKTFAKVIGENGKEFLGADRELSRVRKRIFIRKRKSLNLTDEHFVEYEGHIYSIYDLDEYDVMFYEMKVERVEK